MKTYILLILALEICFSGCIPEKKYKSSGVGEGSETYYVNSRYSYSLDQLDSIQNGTDSLPKDQDSIPGIDFDLNPFDTCLYLGKWEGTLHPKFALDSAAIADLIPGKFQNVLRYGFIAKSKSVINKTARIPSPGVPSFAIGLGIVDKVA